MLKEVIFSGKTIENAVENACAKLGIDSDELAYQIVTMPKKGFLGIGGQEAQISVEVECPDEPKEVKKGVKEEKKTEKKESKKVEKTEKKTEKSEEKEEPKRETRLPTEAEMPQIEAVQKYLTDVIHALGVEKFEMNYVIEGNTIRMDLTGEDLGVVIGRRGETLDALQYLTSLVANRNGETYFRVSLNSGEFRKNREETLKNLAKKKAQYVLKTHRSASFEPMNPYERRIIHSTITEIEGVHSKSVGSDPNRKVVIFPNEKHGEARNNRGNRNNRGRRDNRDRKPSQRVDSKPREGAPLQDEASVSLYTKIEL